MNSETAITRAPPARRAAPQARVAARPAVEPLRVAQHGEIVHGDDERHLRGERPAEGRAVEHVEPPRSRGAQGAGTRRVGRPRPAAAATSPGTTSSRTPSRSPAGRATCRAVPARVWRSGVVSSPTRIRARLGNPRGRCRRSSPTRSAPRAPGLARELVAAGERVADRGGDRLGALGVGADGRVAAGLVHRRVRRRDDRRARGHRLRDRHPEPLEPRRVDDRRRAAVEPRELLVGDAPEPDDARAGRAAAAAPQPAPPATASAELVAPRSANASTSVPRFLRGSSVATVSRYGRRGRRVLAVGP